MTTQIPPFSTPEKNRQIVLAQRPQGTPRKSDFALKEVARPVPGPGQVLVRNLYLSADPVQRGWASNPALTPIDAPMRALAVGIAIESQDPTIAQGDLVYGFLGWQDYAVITRADLLSHISNPRAPLPAYAGILGMPGVTAWLALHDIAPPSEGKAILVSTAAGTVGSIVGQIARQAGAYVVGLTGSDDKIERCVSRFGYNAAFNYKTGDLAETLAAARPEGFDIYFDNTGGWILDTAIRAMAKNGRIVQCGTAATPSWNPPPTGLRNEREILMRTLSWTGFVIFDHVARFGDAIERLTDLLLAGKLVYDEDVENGIDKITDVLEELFAGSNTGKKLIYIGED
ncbi:MULTISPECIES: NADP-dependent oxidoreductase [Sphingobium]|uniref:NADP-dependent oxidoreductase n=1 Tax=Sphingobium sp. MI1205 TaxID=407020 RepID=UPI00076FF1F9|nr:NADP-dependent oxidoreductase [Sphingobium sp. MI1205]AMK19877.1 oxidoreductase zinc-binding protein [Sphingobium sp. MI1205]